VLPLRLPQNLNRSPRRVKNNGRFFARSGQETSIRSEEAAWLYRIILEGREEHVQRREAVEPATQCCEKIS
jgi:hypothetical protein